MGWINIFKPLSTFRKPSLLISLSNIEKNFFWKISDMPGIKPGAARSGSKYANHSLCCTAPVLRHHCVLQPSLAAWTRMQCKAQEWQKNWRGRKLKNRMARNIPWLQKSWNAQNFLNDKLRWDLFYLDSIPRELESFVVKGFSKWELGVNFLISNTHRHSQLRPRAQVVSGTGLGWGTLLLVYSTWSNHGLHHFFLCVWENFGRGWLIKKVPIRKSIAAYSHCRLLSA